jgi:hypothetical protein
VAPTNNDGPPRAGTVFDKAASTNRICRVLDEFAQGNLAIVAIKLQAAQALHQPGHIGDADSDIDRAPTRDWQVAD